MTREEAIAYFEQHVEIMEQPPIHLGSAVAVEEWAKRCDRLSGAYGWAIAALREQEERSNGCEWCEKGRVLCWDSGGEEVCIAQQGKLPVLGTDDWGFAVKLCPMCGRRLEEV